MLPATCGEMRVSVDLGEQRAVALRQAQLEAKNKYPDPLYWDAFICQGYPGPLSEIDECG